MRPSHTGSCADSRDSEAPAEGLWKLDELERLLHLAVKVFQPQFPPYLAYKHVLQRPEAAPSEPAASFSTFCDVHDPEVSVRRE